MTVVILDRAVETNEPIDEDFVRKWVGQIASMLKLHADHGQIAEQLVHDLLRDYRTHIGKWNSLGDDADHVAWLAEYKAQVTHWPFWDRYARYAREHLDLPNVSIKNMDEVTDDILSRLEAPDREGSWDRRGLVSGQVQSGKTSNYTGLIAKALDSGYKLVVVLAGIHNSLRSQTQARIDSGILGFDTRNQLRFDKTTENSRIGVGRMGGPFLPVASFTSSRDNGDFKLNIARNAGVIPGGNDPIILVVKKYKSILENLYKWATALRKEIDPVTGRPTVRDVPILVIDDEADHASVDTSAFKRNSESDETDPTAINRLIRQFLDTFQKSAYVGYTATPFANIFIDPDASHQEAGQDLFPRSFIINLPAPSTYIGPARVFGLMQDSDNAIDRVDPLPIVRDINDHQLWLPDNHKSNFEITTDLPQSLRRAIVAFLIAGATRRIRGEESEHNSMLIHVTRFTRVQSQVKDQVSELLKDITERLKYGEGAQPDLYCLAEKLYDEDNIPTASKLATMTDVSDLIGEPPDWGSVWTEMRNFAERTHVHAVNGTSADALNYVDHPDGFAVIAIGGDKLSRGLTLEGLTVSYYLRASKMYDTLMQMGRWFGYRTGYLDVCRLYTTPQLSKWYSAITAAAAELQAEFDVMAMLGRTPEDFGLRVRQHPDGLLVTSPTKLRGSKSVAISYSATTTSTVTFDLKHVQRNWSQLGALLERLDRDPDDKPRGLQVWRAVRPDVVLDFLEEYGTDDAAIQANSRAIATYIRDRLADGELTDWTIALADVGGDEQAPPLSLAGRKFCATRRKRLQTGDGRMTFRVITSPSHEIIDLAKNTPKWTKLLAETVSAWEQSARVNKSPKPPSSPSGLLERQARDPKKGVLLLYPIVPLGPEEKLWDDGRMDPTTPLVGFGVAFPASERAKPVAYRVNKIFLQLEFGLSDDDE
jgi:hypothetical protein